MTLVIGLKCSDGLVMASDSQALEAAPGGKVYISRHEAKNKISIHNRLMWGCSGSIGTRQIVDEAIKGGYEGIYKDNLTAVDLRLRLVDVVQPLVLKQYQIVHTTSGGKREPPGVNYIFGTYLRKEGFVLINIEMDMDGEVVEGAHCATGSGAKTAQALLCRLRNQGWDVRTALAIAYRTMNDAIHIEPAGIGKPIQLAKVFLKDKTPVFKKIKETDVEYKDVTNTAHAWTVLEQEVLDDLLAGKDRSKAKTPTIPVP